MSYPSIDSDNEVQNVDEFQVNGWVFEKVIINDHKYLKIKSTYPTVNLGFYIEKLTNYGYQPYFYPPDLINVLKFENIENILISQTSYNYYSESLVPVDSTINSIKETDLNFFHDDEINNERVRINGERVRIKRKLKKCRSTIIGLSVSLLIMICIILMYLLDVF